MVQLTPRGSGCSIVFGDLPSQREMAPGSIRGLQLVVADAEAGRAELVARGVECSEIQVFSLEDGGTFFGFSDPDGNTWAVQQLKVRGEKPLIQPEDRRPVRGRPLRFDPAHHLPLERLLRGLVMHGRASSLRARA